MNAVCLQFFVAEAAHHHGKPVYEWLLETARSLGAGGGTAVRAIAGFGRHGWREAEFFELAGELPVKVQFFLAADVADALIAAAGAAGLKLVYARLPAELGATG